MEYKQSQDGLQNIPSARQTKDAELGKAITYTPSPRRHFPENSLADFGLAMLAFQIQFLRH